MMYAYFDALYRNGALFTASQMFDFIAVVAVMQTAMLLVLLREEAKRNYKE